MVIAMACHRGINIHAFHKKQTYNEEHNFTYAVEKCTYDRYHDHDSGILESTHR